MSDEGVDKFTAEEVELLVNYTRMSTQMTFLQGMAVAAAIVNHPLLTMTLEKVRDILKKKAVEYLEDGTAAKMDAVVAKYNQTLPEEGIPSDVLPN